ncbi:MAG: hypothetical protein JNK48_10295 [Bryobacterales bacterium]|nr:hypothetical protein [Bryobacterales bacterium]
MDRLVQFATQIRPRLGRQWAGWTSAACLFLLAVVLTAQYRTGSVALVYHPSDCGCGEVKLPAPWRFSKPLPNSGSLVFRMFNGRILVGSEYDPDTESVNHYALVFVRFTDPIHAVPVSKELWKSAQPVTLHRKSILWNDTPREKITYKGKEYARAGKYWGYPFSAALPSPSGRLIALQSFTGSRTGDKTLQKDGTIYFEVFDTSSGTKVCGVEGVHSDYLGAELLAETFWFSDIFLISSISPDDLQRFLFCDFKPKSLH